MDLILCIISNRKRPRHLNMFGVLLFIAGLLLYTIHIWTRTLQQKFTTSDPLEVKTYSHLGFAHATYVINLPHRDDRRKDMEKLRMALGLQWAYTDGVHLNSSLVRTTLDWVHTIRTGIPHILDESQSSFAEGIAFAWPENIDHLAGSTVALEFWSNGHGVWPLPSAIPKGQPPSQTMASATKDFDISKNISALPEYLLLTEARVACWLGHLNAIHKIANSPMSDDLDFSIILEDDVNMERDIDQQMKRLWPYLPPDWDVVFLGHCWSDEGRGQQLSPHELLNVTAHPSSNSQLHASSKPKCTHAYALSRIGARRLLLHLRYPPFAFSRAIDQAFAWLIESHRVKSYSIVPSLVVQRKVTESDITDSLGAAKWKDKLVMGIFESEDTVA